MRIGLLAVTVLLLGPRPAAAQPAEPPLPPVVFQTQPLGRVVQELRTGADLIGGDKGVKALEEGLKSLFGEKGMEGLDMGRPFFGYVVLAPKPEDITAVIAFPVTGEKEFLELCDRVNKDKLRVDAKDKTLYHLPPLDPTYRAVMRFQDRYAYIAYGFNPMPHIEAKALVPMAKVYDPAEKGVISARLHFDRIPLAVKLAAPRLLEEVKRTMFGGGGRIVPTVPETALKPAVAEIEKLLVRYGKLAADAGTLTARIALDVPNSSLVVEAVLAGKPGTELAKTIAAFKPTANKFAALTSHPDTVAAFKLRAPLFEEELRNAVALSLEEANKEAQKTVREVDKAVLAELLKGFARTAKTGELDVALAVRGPDKNGWFTGIAAVAFDDPSKLEKEFKAFVQKDAPQEILDGIKWDAAKAGTVGIHTYKVPGADFLDPTKVFGGADCTIAFAFAPHGILAAIGPDAVAVLKDALAQKPAPAPVFDVVINPNRTVRLFDKIRGPDRPDADVENILGKEDKLVPVMSATLEGGKELKAALTINLKVLPRAMLYESIQRSGGRLDKVSPPPNPKR